jgi:porin
VIHGRSKLGKNVLLDAGTISPVNHTALTPVARDVNKWFLEEYYLLQGLSEKLSFIAGRVMFSGIGDLNRFAGNEKTQFLNTSLRNSPLMGIISQATSSHGVAVNYSPNPDIIISPFVLSNNDVDGKWGSPGGLFDEYSAGLQLQVSWEVAGLKGYISPIFGYTSVNAADLDNSRLIFDAIRGIQIPDKNDNWVTGFTFDHYVYMPEASKEAAAHTAQFDKEPEGIGVFCRFHYSPENRNPWNIFLSGGVGGRGVIPGRLNDRYGLGFYGLFESDDLKDQPVLGDGLDTEWGMEAFYNIALMPWLQLTPSVQYIQSGVDSINHTTILATRLQMYF